MACKLRVAAKILESGLDDPEAAATTSLLSLKELHDLPTIQEMFSVFREGRLKKASLKKNKRLENIVCMFINRCLCNFAAKHRARSSKSYPVWPEIKLKDHSIHPILNAPAILMNRSSSEKFGESFKVVTDERIGLADCFAVTNLSEIILLSEDGITIIYSTGESKDFTFPEQPQSKFVKREPEDLTVDKYDNMYVVAWFTGDESDLGFNYGFVLYVFDKNGNVVRFSVLSFLCSVMKQFRLSIAVDREENLIIANGFHHQTFVCDNTGKIKFQFERDKHLLQSLCISNNKAIVMAPSYHNVYQVYTPEGHL